MSKKRFIAFIDESCTGCAGTPICKIFCPADGALEYIADESSHHFKRMQVNPEHCMGCRSCVTRGYLGTRIEGCPWDAITMVSANDGEL